ncbi:glucose-6-phosphate isomerase [Candidatus Similichlamydia laticola]|uniref:Glucose-6-phosphate isomerase n=1 Tax=Candidatus Similichlamydia laticola TaxID=2170265 RepID=A0A369KGP4_9BACT|nr:glucose-6-phosphate isomerase [Candidatus Similichlamydia laticola]RDB31875.1 Glucose-6-phosphate isomerase [Candidatus Similichlamydia laticola]
MEDPFLAQEAFLQLRKIPRVDLRQADLTERLQCFHCKALGWTLLFGLTHVDEKICEALWSLAERFDLFSFFQRVKNGEKVNSLQNLPSENRSVLHLAMRSFLTAEQSSVEKVRLEAMEQRERIAQFVEDISWLYLVVIGIGGSHLGLEALYLACSSCSAPLRKVRFLSSCDPREVQDVLRELDLRHTCVAVISKSGKTVEVLENDLSLRALFTEQHLPPKDHFISVTVKGSPLDDPNRFRHCFYFDEAIGGRFCASAAPGALVIAFAFGMSVFIRFLSGAGAMDEVAALSERGCNIPLWMALLGIWHRNVLNLPSKAILPYSYGLRRFPAHLQQLEMESNGKSVDCSGHFLPYGTAPLIWGEPGTNFQHSFGQWLHQSTDEAPVEFICFRGMKQSSERLLLANLFGQALALAKGRPHANPNRCFSGNRPSTLLLGEEMSFENLGALWSLYENRVLFQGKLWQINSFDQEGVQFGKELASQLLSESSALEQFWSRNFFSK